MQQLAIFGGTFDPIHLGHLLIAETALHQVPIEQVIWVPSHHPPHKTAALFEHRLAMLQLATQANSGFTVSQIETKRSGNSYAIDTLIDLYASYPNSDWYWIVGLDTFQTLPRWYRGREIAQMCNWLIAPRLLGGENIAQSELICKQVKEQLQEQSVTIHWQLLNTPLVGISSSLIRKFSGEGRSIRYLVPEEVRSYIDDHNLYKR
ncbi:MULTISPECIES: nicotinate (nicotinamide) nucleotide adenylyltransferase [unclassified Anabaena]|uniref:nicotinate (nicotinamide) nucleotide adenylyltransferase n=1 Tax=unclassified Anabaena TaxID=2619674 RepID=UPI00082D7EBD|nr:MULTISPECIES: nicotinate (nicotinamide) nucleotide adenylyltransferase [unclassified Anabaena]